METPKVAFIGAGNMGAPMARRVKAAGFEVQVCDANPATRAAFAAEGVAVTALARDCASADVVIVLVATDAQILDVVCGPDGVGPAIAPGHRPIVAIMCTTLPRTVQAVAEGLASTAARVLDAPISGGIVRAEEGTLTIMAGGEADDVEAVRPVFEAMGRRLFHCGPLGSAEVVKLVNNAVGIANMYVAAEAIDLAARHGVPFERLAPILEVSTGRNFLTADADEGRRQYAAWARDPEAFRALLNIVGKDLHLVRELAGAIGMPTPLVDRVSDHVDRSDDATMRRWRRAGGLPD